MHILLYILSVSYHRYLYLIILYHVSKRRAKKIPFYKLQELLPYFYHQAFTRKKKDVSFVAYAL